MDKEKIKGYINIAHKAGYLIFNGEKLEEYNKKLYLVLFDPDAGKNTLKIIEKLKDKYPIAQLENLAEYVNIKNCKIVGIKNKDLSEIILKLINQ